MTMCLVNLDPLGRPGHLRCGEPANHRGRHNAISFDQYRAADSVYREYAAASRNACDARAALDAGSSRAKVTSANARWARAAEARDRREAELLALWGTP